LNKKSLKIPKG